jgi:hypothetical protein
MNLTKQQRTLLICLTVLVGSCAARSVVDSILQRQYAQQQAAIRAAQQRAMEKARADAAQRASAAATTPAVPKSPAGVPARAPASTGSLAGIWHGRIAITGRGICTLSLELHEDEPGQFSGFSSLACANFAPLMPPQDQADKAAAVLNRMNPASAILSGAMENGSIHFKVDRTIDASGNGCAATSFTVTPFGTNQLAAEWQEEGCSGGHVILQKARI